MKKKLNIALFALIFSMFLQGCATPRPGFGEEQVRLGRVERIEEVAIDSDAGFGVGAILGGVVGGILGNQIGGGRGRDVATVLGVLGGGYAGAKTEQKLSTPIRGQEITVRLDNRVLIEITQEFTNGLRIGDRVRIIGSGEDARVRLN